MSLVKNYFSVIFVAIVLTACGGGSSSSGGGGTTEPGNNIPASFVGTYKGQMNLKVSVSGISESEIFPISIVVRDDGTVTLIEQNSKEEDTVGITNEGKFSAEIVINEDECKGTAKLQGQVDGSRAWGDVSGSAECVIDGEKFNGNLSGNFSANK